MRHFSKNLILCSLQYFDHVLIPYALSSQHKPIIPSCKLRGKRSLDVSASHVPDVDHGQADVWIDGLLVIKD